MSDRGMRPAPPNVIHEERLTSAMFSAHHAEPAFRERQQVLQGWWSRFNAEHFQGSLDLPHIWFGVTPTRSYGFYKKIADNGSLSQITISSKVIFGTTHSAINRGWPAEGTKRFIEDVLLHETIHQYHHEVTGKTDDGYGGHGPNFAVTCNEIGGQLGLQSVICRRRVKQDGDAPLCAYWPYNVRPPDYYLGDVDVDKVVPQKKKPVHGQNLLIVFEYLLDLCLSEGYSKMEQILQEEVRSLRSASGPESMERVVLDSRDWID